MNWKWLLIPILLAIVCVAPTRAADVGLADRAAAHAKLDEILHQPQFTAWQLRQSGASIKDAGLESLADRLENSLKGMLDDLRDFIKWLFRGRPTPTAWRPTGSGSLPFIFKVLGWTVIAIIALFVAIILIRLIGAQPTQVTTARILSRAEARQAIESGDALAMGALDWMDEARRLAEEKDFRAVYRALYLALLSGLHTAGKIEHNRNRTNWTYVNHYRGPAEERERFSRLTDLFDRVWYGHKSAQGNSLDRLRADVASLISDKGEA
jgi:hypothetical protein